MDIGAWLRGLSLGQYERAFRVNDVAPDLLADLTAEDLKELGVASVGHRRRMLEAIAALRRTPATPRGIGADASQAAEARSAGTTRSGVERRQLTVAFVDLVGSTALAERLDPEELRDVMRGYHDACTAVLSRFGGHIAKYLGDGVLAYFGWPATHEDEAERATRAGLVIVQTVAELPRLGDGPLQARVGIATGLVVVGDLLGKGAAREEAVVGETPNLAARLQALAQPGGVIVADSTRRLLGKTLSSRIWARRLCTASAD